MNKKGLVMSLIIGYDDGIQTYRECLIQFNKYLIKKFYNYKKKGNKNEKSLFG